MAKKTKREESYGNYVFRRTRKGRTEIFARVGYYDENGVWKYKYEKAEDEDDAKEKAKNIIKLYKKRGTAYIDGSQMTFEQFADWYKEKYVIPPVYENGQQVEGLRTFKDVRTKVDRLKLQFGKKRLARITETHLTEFANKRRNVDGVKTATVNRDLEMLATMFSKAVKRGWLEESPFRHAENLIRKSLEARRTMTVSAEEERLVFDFAQRSSNKYLFPLVLALRDCGARPSELFPFAAYGVDLDTLAEKIKGWLENGIKSDEQVYFPLCWFQLFKVEFQVVPLISVKSRQVEYRFGTMTARLRSELLKLWESSPKNPISLVFPFKSIKKEWEKIRLNVALYTVFSRIRTMVGKKEQREALENAFGDHSKILFDYLSSENPDAHELIAKAFEINAKLRTDDVELRDLRIRDWRRIWRSKADRAGVSDQTAQRILGHKLLQTSYHYNEADLEAVIEASKRLDELNVVNDKIN